MRWSHYFFPGTLLFPTVAAGRIEREFYATPLDPVSGQEQTQPRMVDQLGERVFLRFFPHLVLHPAPLRIADTATTVQAAAAAAKVDPSPFALNID